MITTYDLKLISRMFIHLNVPEEVKLDDIRSFKKEQGTFPVKHIFSEDEYGNEVQVDRPYILTDNFILFDIVIKNNLVYNSTDTDSESMITYTLTFLMFGDGCENVSQYFQSKIRSSETWLFATEHKISFTPPEEIEIVDTIINNMWWKIRRIKFDLTIKQTMADENFAVENIDLYKEVI